MRDIMFYMDIYVIHMGVYLKVTRTGPINI
jgi:hypothetical protein